MKPKYTPGPWGFEKTAAIYEGEDTRNLLGDGKIIAQRMVIIDHPEAEANARLIKAAPSLVETMHEIAQLAHNGSFPDMTSDELRKLLFSCGNRAMIAIAKVTGDDE